MEGQSPSNDKTNASNQCAISLAVGGMTCVACVRAITDAVSELEGVSDVVVSQLGKSASAVVVSPDLIASVVILIEDIGYECTVISVTPTAEAGSATKRTSSQRSVALQLVGLESIPSAVVETLQKDHDFIILEHHISDPSNVLRIQYTPSPPHLTIRSIISNLSAALPVTESHIQIWHPPSSDEVAQRMYRKEQRDLLIRLVVAVIAVIPIFIIGIVYMSLLNEGSPGRKYFETPIWAGQVTRGEWALFLTSTPVMFYAAEGFHRRSLQELRHLWRPGSRASWGTRFFRFGSMNLLISLGVSVAYFSSVAQLAISASRDSNLASRNGQPMTYFDSVAFLTMFLLIGRFIEAFSKHQAASAISLLGQLRSTEALLLTAQASSASSTSSSSSTEEPRYVEKTNVLAIPVDLLEVGDIVRVPPGATPPADGTIVSLESTNFDESSLTGESRTVPKSGGDQVFVGSINKTRSVDIRVDAVEGETMLDQVIEAVRQGQTKRAPIERIVDVITSHFVPVITALAIVTWVIWLSLGLSGVLPASTLDGNVGGWAFWSLEFAISVFVIACPCGIGLAAPTALLVGSGLAAKFGILARGGGEAFQEASQIDVIIFDKTGTLTEGTEPKVTDSTIFPPPEALSSQLSTDKWNEVVAKIVLQLASASSHPLCLSLRNHFRDLDSLKDGILIATSNVDEHPGCGMSGSFTIEVSRGGEIIEATVFLGNEIWLQEKGVSSDHDRERVHHLRAQGKSVVLLAMELPSTQTSNLIGVFAVADPIRPEAHNVIKQLHTLGIETWMISGDNRVTAQAVALSVGISQENVIAGVLPHQKAEKIRWLQTLPKENAKIDQQSRKIVAMVGDGINDAPALTAADVGIAMGSGSDIALSSAKFVLLSSDLNTLLVLSDLSRKVFRRIKFNFGWALVYNVIALPIAAGVIYPAGHARLSPVWSSLAMALSSTSVVCSSLLLRRYRKPTFDSVAPPQPYEAEKAKQDV